MYNDITPITTAQEMAAARQDVLRYNQHLQQRPPHCEEGRNGEKRCEQVQVLPELTDGKKSQSRRRLRLWRILPFFKYRTYSQIRATAFSNHMCAVYTHQPHNAGEWLKIHEKRSVIVEAGPSRVFRSPASSHHTPL